MKNTEDVIRRASEWASCGERGISSEAIWAVMMGVPADKIDASTPADAGDFNRCATLIEIIPEWKTRLPEVAALFPIWTGIVEHWDDLYKALLNLRSARAIMKTRRWKIQNDAHLRFEQLLDLCQED